MNRFTYTMMTALMAILALAMVTGQASAKEVDLSKTAFKYGKMKYWRGKAENVRIGSYGDKKVNGKYLAVDCLHQGGDDLDFEGLILGLKEISTVLRVIDLYSYGNMVLND